MLCSYTIYTGAFPVFKEFTNVKTSFSVIHCISASESLYSPIISFISKLIFRSPGQISDLELVLPDVQNVAANQIMCQSQIWKLDLLHVTRLYTPLIVLSLY